ncbi:MAG: 4Fe-4S binding protein, partial [bacterium]|nr:4Fe-4S binding protein [bacterium]
IMGYAPMDIPTTKDAYMRGLGNGKLEEIEILGKQIDEIKVDFEKVPIIRDEIRERFRNFFLSKMSVDKTKCKNCNLCMKQCPAKAIELKPYPVFAPEKCILCFCCFELCPEGAVSFEMPRLVGKSSLITREMEKEQKPLPSLIYLLLSQLIFLHP